MPIHEKTLIDPQLLVESDKLVVDGVDVSGHWNTWLLYILYVFWVRVTQKQAEDI